MLILSSSLVLNSMSNKTAQIRYIKVYTQLKEMVLKKYGTHDSAFISSENLIIWLLKSANRHHEKTSLSHAYSLGGYFM